MPEHSCLRTSALLFFLYYVYFSDIHLMVCLCCYSVCWDCLSSHITLAGPLTSSGLFKGYFLSDDFPDPFIYILIYSPSIIHFKRQKGEMKFPSFPVFYFLLSLLTLPCTEYFPFLFIFVSATGIKASIWAHFVCFSHC